jgi:hypothetical protein
MEDTAGEGADAGAGAGADANTVSVSVGRFNDYVEQGMMHLGGLLQELLSVSTFAEADTYRHTHAIAIAMRGMAPHPHQFNTLLHHNVPEELHPLLTHAFNALQNEEDTTSDTSTETTTTTTTTVAATRAEESTTDLEDPLDPLDPLANIEEKNENDDVGTDVEMISERERRRRRRRPMSTREEQILRMSSQRDPSFLPSFFAPS